MTGFIDHFYQRQMSFLSQIGKNKVEDKLVKLIAQSPLSKK